MRSLRLLPPVALGFTLLGVLVALWGDGPLFEMWREQAIATLFAGQEPPHWPAFAEMTFGILGGTIAGKWLAAYWIARGPLQRGERWAKSALVWGLVTWFVADSAVSVAYGAWFNVWMINLVPIATFGVLLAGVPAAAAVPPARAPRTWRALLVACALSAVLGLVIAFGTGTALFGSWRAAAATALGMEGLSPALVEWLGFIAGPIGGTTLAHFVMLSFAVRHAPRQRWTLVAVASSVGAWFLIDSACSLARGASFNVWLVNVPAFLLVAVPWAFAARTR